MGTLRLHVAQDASEAWHMLQAAQPLHKQRWGKAALEYECYHTFHKELIHSSFATGCLDVLRVDCGDTPIGWLYNFIYDNRVYYYFGAFDFDSENAKLKPGLVTHTLAIEHYAKKGLGVYDFMAGNLRYKFNLGQVGSPIRTVALQNPAPIIRVEHAARAVKRLLRV
jgi:CelD/BcsL family acetyltransferase involved in cellulose biosynthesis